MPRHGGRGTAWDRFRLTILDKDGFQCCQCGRWGNQVDHINRLADGGPMFDPANVQVLCVSCHVAKTRRENTRPNPERDKWRDYMAKMRS